MKGEHHTGRDKAMTKEEHKATKPTARNIRLWNWNNAEKYTKAEHKAANPDATEMRCWNWNNEDEYTDEEIAKASIRQLNPRTTQEGTNGYEHRNHWSSGIDLRYTPSHVGRVCRGKKKENEGTKQ